MGKIQANTFYTKNDVKYYGAIGDGYHDDTEAIQNALNNSTYIVFEEGVYIVSRNIKVPNNVNIYGRNVIIQRISDIHILEIETSNVKIKNITFDGNNRNYSIIYIEGFSNILDGCSFMNSGIYGHGVCLDGQRSGYCMFNAIKNCNFNNCLGVSISNNMTSENIFISNFITNSGFEGITLDNYSRFSIIKNNIIRNSCINGGVGTIGIDASSYSIISENIITECNEKPGICMQNNINSSMYNVISSNIISGLHVSSGNNYGIEIHGYEENSNTKNNKSPKYNLISSNISHNGISSNSNNVIGTNLNIELPVIVELYGLQEPNLNSENVLNTKQLIKTYSTYQLENINFGFRTGNTLVSIRTLYLLTDMDYIKLSLISSNKYFVDCKYNIDNENNRNNNEVIEINEKDKRTYKLLTIYILYNNTEIIPHFTNTTDIVHITINDKNDYTLKRPDI